MTDLPARLYTHGRPESLAYNNCLPTAHGFKWTVDHVEKRSSYLIASSTERRMTNSRQLSKTNIYRTKHAQPPLPKHGPSSGQLNHGPGHRRCRSQPLPQLDAVLRFGQAAADAAHPPPPSGSEWSIWRRIDRRIFALLEPARRRRRRGYGATARVRRTSGCIVLWQANGMYNQRNFKLQ